MIPELGLVCLILALMMALVLAFVAPIGLINPKASFLQSLARPAAFGQCFFVLLSFLTLMRSFVQDDFSVQYIAQNSNANLPTIYKFCALWGAHEGSLLLWALILTLWTLAVALYSRKLPTNMAVSVMAVLGAISVGFLVLLLQTSNPFLRLLPFAANEGADLNPLLQDPGFVLHPPFLYMGYVGFAVPFAFAISALIFKDSKMWSVYARPFALLAWAFLTLGITLGSWWAYYELGWGGWWFWDPVENASFMPWLVGAALGHALLVSRQDTAFNTWGILLALSAFILSLIGTFLVRSGVVSSVHAFASDPLRGTFILCFLAIVIFFSFILFVSRTTGHSQKMYWLSRESWILLGNMIFFVATCTVLLGTLYPIMIEVLFEERLSVGPPYFNAVFVPIMMPLLLLMALAPHLQWRENRAALFWLKIKKHILVFALGLVAIAYLLRHLPFLTLLGLAVGLWVIWGTLFKLIIDWKNNGFRLPPVQRWGMILAHLGLGIAVLGMSLTTSLSIEREMKIAPGENVNIEGYLFTFQAIQPIQGSNYEGLQGHFTIEKDAKKLTLYPEKRFFIPRNMPMTETAISPGLWRDFYIALGERLDDGSWTVRFYIKPFVRWIWLGGILIAMGAFISSLVCFRNTFRGAK
ncbi:MAG: hypothetical protein BGO43_12255 [Gammaproteobacteria bacterium 39-13]|nr:heme lyase CcmF/NrfE family subunit [Gammaproteobacteria bacterium]OJV92272.1 MAG: hypothetical protein BGO43_12255 [Gammaproteobacteria bacterium 39-13]